MAFSAFQFSFDPETGGYNLDELNHFVVGKLVKSRRFEFCLFEGRPTWSCILEWEYAEVEQPNTFNELVHETKSKEPKAAKTPKPAPVLADKDLLLFEQLKKWRNRLAEQKQWPAYTVMTNDKLAVIAQSRPKSISELSTIKGIGQQKIEKYGQEILTLIAKCEVR